jgi:hypothetical protein
MAQDDRKYFLIKHDRESLLALRHFIWRTGKDSKNVPHRFDQIRIGDRWVSFAYIDNERDERRISQITGFSECVRTKYYDPLPPEAIPISGEETEAWFIKGEPYGEQPSVPVDVPPIAQILGRRLFNQEAISVISADEFGRLRECVVGRVTKA